MPSPRKVSPSPSRSACTSFLNERSIAGPWRDSWGPNYISKSALHMRGQPKRNYREGDQDHQPDQVRDDKGNNALEDRREADVLNHAFYDEYVHADRRMDQPEFHRHHDDDAEPDRIEAEMGDDWEDNRHGQDDHRHRIHQAAERQVHQHDQRQPAVGAQAQ